MKTNNIKLTKTNRRNLDEARKKFGCLGEDLINLCLCRHLAEQFSQRALILQSVLAPTPQ